MKRPDLVFVGAVLLCLPMAPSVIHGNVTATAALERFLGALLVSWLVGYVLSKVVGRYSNEARRAEILRQIQDASDGAESVASAIAEGAEQGGRRKPQATGGH